MFHGYSSVRFESFTACSRTSSDASVNYTVQEYANDVVYTIKDVCNNENVPEPDIVSESGRALVAYHSMLVVDVLAEMGGTNGNSKPKAFLAPASGRN